MTTQAKVKLAICKCGKEFKPYYRNEIIVSKKCPSCRHKEAYEKGKDKPPIQRNNPKFATKTSGKPKKKKTPRQCAMDRADEWFSKYIRLRYSFEDRGELYCRCYTCNRPHPIKQIENGHYVNREHKTVRFHPNNARPQCTHCNCYRSGKHAIFGTKLAKEIGVEEVDNLRQMSMFPGEDNELFYREQANKYRKLFNQLLKEKGIKNPWRQ
jgi:hypothetical protein